MALSCFELNSARENHRKPSDGQAPSSRQDSAWTFGNETLRDSVDYSSPEAHSGETARDAAQWPRSWRAYMVLLSGFLMMMNCWGLISSFGAFLGLYDKHLLPHTPDLALGLIGGTQAFLVLVLSPITGRLLDAQYHYWVGFTGFLLTFIGYLGLSFTSKEGLENQGTYWSIWLTNAIAGLGEACVFIYSSQNAVQWFPRQRFVAIGITSAGTSIGGLVYPLAFKYLVGRFNFPVSVRIFSGIVGVTAFIAAVGGPPNPNVAKRSLGPIWKASTWIDKHAFHSAAFKWFAASISLLFLGYYALPFYVTLWAANKKLGLEEDIPGGNGELPGSGGFRSFWFLSIMNSCSLFGRIGSGYIATRLSSPLLTTAISSVATGLICLTWWPLTASTPSAIAFCVAFGILGGSIMGLPASCIASLIPATSLTHLGQWTGMAFAISAVPALVGPMIAGALFRTWGENSVGFWSGGMLVGAGVCQGMAWRVLTREKKRTEKVEGGGLA